MVGHCRDTWWLGTAGILGGWSRKSASSRARTTSTLKSNNPTARVGKYYSFGVLGPHFAARCLVRAGAQALSRLSAA